MTLLNLVFWLLAVVSVGAALAVVSVRDIFKAALFLVVAFLTLAGFFVILSAEFLAVVQVLIYAGAISILIIFAIMLTRDVAQGNPPNRLQPVAVVVASLLLAAIIFVAYQTDWPLLSSGSPETQEAVEGVLANTPQELGGLLVQEFILPFEIAAAILLAAVVGAIALVREP